MKKFIEKIPAIMLVVVLLWIFLSWCDITADNCFPNPVHHPLNFFVLMSKGWVS